VVDDQVLAVGVPGREHQQHGVVQDVVGVGRLLGGEAVHDVHQSLRVADLGGVQGPLDEVDGLAAFRQPPSLGLGDPGGGQPLVVADDPVEVAQVPGRADEHGRVVVAHGRLVHDLVLDPVGTVADQAEVLLDPVEPGELAGRSHGEAEEVFGRWNGRALCRARDGTAHADRVGAQRHHDEGG
jgi:hypothetical protein